ncbi:MAG: ATP-binding protein [Clostridiales bacterium]|jgi:serine/threonine-protein kinase RsbW|nr:ATP-binding protein [Clostridiales bacterium]
MPLNFKRSFCGDARVAKEVVAAAVEFLRGVSNVAADEANNFRLILSELLYNAVIHGNKNNSEKNVYLSVEIADDFRVTCVIRDDGDGFDHKKLVAGFGKDNWLESEHGRGVWLAFSLADELYYNEIGNELTFIKALTCGGMPQ